MSSLSRPCLSLSLPHYLPRLAVHILFLWFGSSTQSAPLLAAAQTPAGAYSRLAEQNRSSEASLASSYDQTGSARYGPSAGQPGMPPSSFSSATNARYGPTANLSPASSSASHANRFSPGVTSENVALRGPAPGSHSYDHDEEIDDKLHTFTAADRKDLSAPFVFSSWRGWSNALTLFVLLAGFVMLFAGYPIINYYRDNENSNGGNTAGYNLGGINGSGQYPELSNFPQMIDPDTPDSAKIWNSPFDNSGSTWNLVFSDEFNKPGRTFYPGDDPFFTAVDIHYWPTNDLEWYDPGTVTTRDGHLVITLTQQPIHNLMFKSGMVQSWNQLCFFKNAYIEVSASLPGVNDVSGFWPGIWTMGNLGRPGYGATNDGLWPYSYSSCDVGIMPNQTYATNNGTGPAAALTTGDQNNYNGALSYLPGQRLSACPCPGADHPGPPGVGRGAVEIDIIEAQIDPTVEKGAMSQSAQFAPFDDFYQYDNTSKAAKIWDKSVTHFNSYLGGVYQEAVSGVSYVDNAVYANVSGQFRSFGVEWSADLTNRQNGYVGWINQGKPAWQMFPAAVGPNPRVEIGQRLISEEPMALIFNLGMSNNFDLVRFNDMIFPNEMRIDYVRVYQKEGGSVGCDPPERPTADYINRHINAYSNANLTTWKLAGNDYPKNTFGGC
ncbi:Beta-glucan synthesis-associated protein KRE6 [Vanrija pseudolonga]|uniref:Beta-glucan synthesis-associated protein KRE6 n=1 Tax=Vanrija pseudolonga TaxID=143232 RepID=A0AAF1BIX8_9TREE|nr:Beta-glucan synthesis-associated protein KRE6 [Vanrija pseudolonga]